MKLLQFIKEITDNEEEFLAVIQEMNRWVQDEKEEQRLIHMPHSIGRFNFSRDEYKQALDLCSQAIQNANTNKYNEQHRANQNSCDHLLFHEASSMDSPY